MLAKCDRQPKNTFFVFYFDSRLVFLHFMDIYDVFHFAYMQFFLYCLVLLLLYWFQYNKTTF